VQGGITHRGVFLLGRNEEVAVNLAVDTKSSLGTAVADVRRIPLGRLAAETGPDGESCRALGAGAGAGSGSSARRISVAAFQSSI
jgi:hypothetical protein